MNNYEKNACGVYTPATQFNVDKNKLIQLGFSDNDIQVMQYVAQCSGKINISELQKCGVEYDRAQRIKYMYDIVSGRVSIESKDDLSKHFRKLFGKHNRIGIADLAVSRVNKVPRWAIVGGVKDKVYESLNSNKLPVNKRLYKVVKVGTRINVETDNKIILPYKYTKKINGVLELIGKDSKSGKTVLAFNKNYCKLCNRYIIVASLRIPENHLGMVEIICVEGTHIYVYAKNLGVSENVSYSGGNARVYDYGIKVNEIDGRLKAVAEVVYKGLMGVYAEYVPANQDFNLITPDEKPENDIIY